MAHDFVTLVSGLPRSGTSMMMRMLEAGGLPVLADHLRRVETWLAEQPNLDVLYVSYNELIQDPEPHCARVVQFLGLPLDSRRMASVVSGALYRQRR